MKYEIQDKIEYTANHTVLGIKSIKYNAYNSKQRLCMLCIKYNALISIAKNPVEVLASTNTTHVI